MEEDMSTMIITECDELEQSILTNCNLAVIQEFQIEVRLHSSMLSLNKFENKLIKFNQE